MVSIKKITPVLLAAGLAGGTLGFALFFLRPATRVPAGGALPAIRPLAAVKGIPLVVVESPPANESTPSPADPLAQRDAGYRVISSLQNSGAFGESARYAAAGPVAFRRDLLIAAYFEWGRHQPEAAVQSAIQLSDAAAREIAMQSVWSGWARVDPAGMAETALSLPESPERTAALTKAIRAWMIHDPEQAGDWILAHDNTFAAAETVFRTEQR